jgi:lipoate-protein ligase A
MIQRRTIIVVKSTAARLRRFKLDHDITYDEAITLLLDSFKEYQKIISTEVCNDNTERQ